MFFGTINQYMQTMKLTQKWNMKKQGLPVPGEEKDEKARLIDSLRPTEEELRAQTVTAITDKLRRGKRLSDKELSFLRDNAPDLYRKAVQIQRERADYERRLKECRSKEQVEKLHTEKMSAFASEAKAICASGMPLSAKRGALDLLGMRQAAIEDEHQLFLQSERYQKLPNRDRENREKRI